MSDLKRKIQNLGRHMSFRSKTAQMCALMLLIGTGSSQANAQTAGPEIHTNESFINGLKQKSTLDITNQKAVLKHILDRLPKTVTVYPTEGYYYFSFYKDNVKYAGNIRLDYDARKKGKLYFNYFKATNGWSYEDKDYFVTLGKKDGVIVQETENLTYKVSIQNTSVIFKLVDLSKLVPPKDTLRKDEQYIGPVYDESGVRFYLIFNPNIKIFHYVLDETNGATDELMPLKNAKDISIGRRTGFAFYNDKKLNRKILVGVNESNSTVNNYYDGPFDQLPDSFIKGDELKNAILLQEPDLKGKIDRFGNFDGEARRYLIAPYMYYHIEQDLQFFTECITKKITPDMYQCFLAPTSDDDVEPEKNAKTEKKTESEKK